MIIQWGNSKIRQLFRARSGTAAVEFAIILPLLLTVLIGMVNLFDGQRASRLMTRVAVTVADLVTREDDIFTDDDFTEQQAIAETILGSYAVGTSFNLAIASIVNPFGGAGTPVLQWSLSTDPAKRICQDDLENYEVPQIPVSDSVILVDVSGTFSPTLLWRDWTTYNLSEIQVRRPRVQDEIEYDGTSVC